MSQAHNSRQGARTKTHAKDATSKRTSISIATLAKHCQLSEGTVSRALNNYPDIAEKTRARVREAARSLGYHPSSNARSLARGIVETVGFVMPGTRDHLSDPFLSQILDGLAVELAEHNWDLMLSAVPEGHDEIEVLDRLIRAGKVGGFAITRVRRQDPRIDFLRNANVPFVVHGRSDDCDDYAWLDMDNHKAFVDAVNHLSHLGHKNIAYLGGDQTYSYAKMRREGFLSGLANHTLSPQETTITDDLIEQGQVSQFVQHLMALPQRPTALLCVTDTIAIYAMKALTAMGIRVGSEISVMGYDGLPSGNLVEPSLTTMSQPTYEAGRQIGKTLLAMTKQSNLQNSQILWEAKLTQRASTQPPPNSLAAADHREREV